MTITATYSPEDNKLRLYSTSRLDEETYAKVKEAGYVWAPKQGLFVAPRWTPSREDLAIQLAGEIEPEEMTLAERAAIKAERLDAMAARAARKASAYSRAADELSQAFAFGQPILVGHHSERRARRTQEKVHRAMDKSGELARTANYWLYRAGGVERFANMKNSPRVRAGRIKTLLAELRDVQRDINRGHDGLAMWGKLTSPALIAHALGAMNARALFSTWDDYSESMQDGADLLAIRDRCMKRAERAATGDYNRRWIEHILCRLDFERELLGPVSRYEGELTPVILQAFAREHGAEKPKAERTDPGFFELSSPVPLPAHLASGRCYLELSEDEWRDLMQSAGYEVPAVKEGPPPLLNLDVSGHVSRNPYYKDKLIKCRVVRCTKAQYGKVPSEYRGTRESVCGGYRFKVALVIFLGVEARTEANRHEYVAVFLTDSKAHDVPSSYEVAA